jgi:hypothetical protein
VKLSTLLYTDYFKLPKEARKYQNKTLNWLKNVEKFEGYKNKILL